MPAKQCLASLKLAVLVLALAACDPQSSAPPPVTATPSDPKLAQLYERTCKSCHGSPGTGAPLAGDTAAWRPRLAQGMDTLMDRTINGYKGMPPLGSCPDCGEKEFEALIRFMAGA